MNARYRHGMYNTPIYGVWEGIKQRCLNPKCKVYIHYGGRGITLCDEWKDFVNFYKDMGERPSDKHTVERKDNSKGYSKDNCYWATWVDQANNTRKNNNVTWSGVTMSLSRWARELGISRAVLDSRLRTLGWSVDRAFTTPASRSNAKSQTDLCGRGHSLIEHGYVAPGQLGRRCKICSDASKARYKERHRLK